MPGIFITFKAKQIPSKCASKVRSFQSDSVIERRLVFLIVQGYAVLRSFLFIKENIAITDSWINIEAFLINFEVAIIIKCFPLLIYQKSTPG
ncbi:hypothetical protein EGR_00749 [Echinococcus granulosus]|uniref:Uncharacterized protein n=1 Tax=Echinococcus granulosus TaxID=6210 RepID=W6UR58_ECHGR|nr:hypothetical protein EGR_00749 [Echinococcus granulosus]EUB64205.1 hypothetical protein EGR_00749 [Echinococcus granulosus]